MVLEELMGLTDEEFMDSLLFDIRFQYALHTISFKEQPVSDRTFSRFRRRCLTYETETGIDLIHDTVKELSGEMAALMKLNDRMKRMDSLMVASNMRKFGRMELWVPRSCRIPLTRMQLTVKKRETKTWLYSKHCGNCWR